MGGERPSRNGTIIFRVSGTLYVVATPIGNLEDITLRALRVLREVDVIAAEDTRRTARLLSHYGIQTRSISFHDHNVRSRLPALIAQLEKGASVALVSDAGTPAVSDPGVELVQACIARAIPIDVVPGPSAVVTALVASGFPTAPVTFMGFAPARAKDRASWLSDVATIKSTVVFFETPHRIRALLDEAVHILGERPLFVGRELTKTHQEYLRGTADAIGKCLKLPRGEFTVVVAPLAIQPNISGPAPQGSKLTDEFGLLTEFRGLTRRAAIAELASKYGLSSREVYARLEAAKRPVS